MISNLRRGHQIGYKENVLNNKCDEALEKTAQKGGGCLTSETPKVTVDGAVSTCDLAVGDPVHCRGVGLDGF